MRQLVLIFCFLLFASNTFAAKYYVFIDKIGKVQSGQEAGQTEKGDVIGIYPFTGQFKPTKAERSRYQIIIIDLTDEEQNQLLEKETEIIGKGPEGQDILKTVKARKRKINYEELSLTKQEQTIEKTILFEKIVVKPSSILIP